MPLVPGDSRESVGKNISILRSEGKPPKQAIAIALNMAGKSKTASVEDLAGEIAADPVKLAMWETMKASLRGPEQGTKAAQEELEKLAAPYDRAAGMRGALQGASIGGVWGAGVGASNAHHRGEDVSQGALETGLILAALGGLLGSTRGLPDNGYYIDKAHRLPSPGPSAADELFRGTKTAQEELEKLSFSLPNPFASKPPAPPPEDPHARRMRLLQTLGPMDDWGVMSDAEMDAWQPSPMTPEAAAAYIAKYPDAPHMPAEGMPYTRRHSTELKTAQEELKKLAVSRAWIRNRVNAGLTTGVPKSRFKEVGARLYDSAPEGLKGSKKRYAGDIAEHHGTARPAKTANMRNAAEFALLGGVTGAIGGAVNGGTGGAIFADEGGARDYAKDMARGGALGGAAGGFLGTMAGLPPHEAMMLSNLLSGGGQLGGLAHTYHRRAAEAPPAKTANARAALGHGLEGAVNGAGSGIVNGVIGGALFADEGGALDYGKGMATGGAVGGGAVGLLGGLAGLSPNESALLARTAAGLGQAGGLAHTYAERAEKTAAPWGSILGGAALGGAAGAGIGALGAHARGGDVGNAALKGGLGGAAGGAALGGLHGLFKNNPSAAGWGAEKLAPGLIEKGMGAGLVGAGTLAGGAVTSAAFGDGIAEEMRAKEIGKFNAQQELLAQQRQALAPKHQEAFQRAMADDTVQRAPQDIIHSAFETMRTFAPNLAADPNATLSFLRESAIYGTGPSYASIKSLADSEKSVVSAAKLAGANR